MTVTKKKNSRDTTSVENRRKGEFDLILHVYSEMGTIATATTLKQQGAAAFLKSDNFVCQIMRYNSNRVKMLSIPWKPEELSAKNWFNHGTWPWKYVKFLVWFMVHSTQHGKCLSLGLGYSWGQSKGVLNNLSQSDLENVFNLVRW